MSDHNVSDHEDGEQPAAREWSRPVAIYDVTEKGLALTIEASEPEAEALARRFGARSLSHVEARLDLRTEPDGSLLLQGNALADVVQSCIITGEPVKSSIASRFSVRYISPGKRTESLDGEALDVLEEDTELLPSDVIDAGEVVAQYLSLAMDPYPRKPGASVGVVELTADGAVPGTERANPFAVLRKLQDGG